MNPPNPGICQASSTAQPKTFSIISIFSLIRACFRLCLGIATWGLAFHGFAAEPSLSGSTAVAQTQTTQAEATSAAPTASTKFDWSKQPPVSAPPRPGIFSIPPTGPGYYSLSDLITGNKREGAPVFPYAPYALMTTPAFDMDFRYREKTGI